MTTTTRPPPAPGGAGDSMTPADIAKLKHVMEHGSLAALQDVLIEYSGPLLHAAERVERLEKALEEYGQHAPACRSHELGSVMWPGGGMYTEAPCVCTCGFDAALKDGEG